MAQIKLNDKDHGHQLAETLNMLRIEQKWTDCCIETRTGKVYVHHVVLAAVVQKFQITSLILNRNEETFLLKDFTEHIVEILITYLYTGILNLTNEIDILEFIMLCKHLDLNTLLRHEIFKKHLAPENIDSDSVVFSDDMKQNGSEINNRSKNVPYPIYLTRIHSKLVTNFGTEQNIDNVVHNENSSVNSSDKMVPVTSNSVSTVSDVENTSGLNMDSGEQPNEFEMEIKQEILLDDDISFTINMNTSSANLSDTSGTNNKKAAKQLSVMEAKGCNFVSKNSKKNKNTLPLSSSSYSPLAATCTVEMEGSHDEIKVEQDSDSNIEKNEEIVQSKDSSSLDNQKIYECSECSKKFDRRWNLLRHLGTHKTDKDDQCECGKQFSHKNQLVTHRKKHINPHPYTCSHCGKLFSSKVGLESHCMRDHGGTRTNPYKCHICDKVFGQKSHLTNHMFCHSNIKSYKCDECGKTFKHSRSQRRHVLICKKPEKEKPLPELRCDQCGLMFDNKQYLQTHVKYVHGEPSYQCTKCGLMFKWPSSLHRHISKDLCSNKLILM